MTGRVKQDNLDEVPNLNEIWQYGWNWDNHTCGWIWNYLNEMYCMVEIKQYGWNDEFGWPWWHGMRWP
jgi:hypothetical protein